MINLQVNHWSSKKRCNESHIPLLHYGKTKYDQKCLDTLNQNSFYYPVAPILPCSPIINMVWHLFFYEECVMHT